MSGERVILASGSPRRHQLLDLVGIAHEVMPPDIDESVLAGESPAVYAERLARGKGAVVATRIPEAVVIAADTIVVIDGAVLGKPRDTADAMRMLRALAGRTHTVITAVAAVHAGRLESVVVPVSVTMRPLGESELAAYVATGEPMDKAGAYGIQGYGATIVERVDGDFFAVMGLSLVGLIALLHRLGIRYAFGPL